MQNKPFLLIAEDDPDDQLLIQDVIQVVCAPELQTRFVWDGAELISFLKTAAAVMPSLVVLDLNMPGKDGRTALREIKADPHLARIPVAVLTTSNNELDLQYCRDYGAVACYRKPGSVAEFQEIIRHLCVEFLT